MDGGGYGGARRRRRLRSARVRGRGQRGESHGESERGPEGLRGTLSQLQAVGGKQEVAHGGARASGTRPSSWQRRKTTGE